MAFPNSSSARFRRRWSNAKRIYHSIADGTTRRAWLRNPLSLYMNVTRAWRNGRRNGLKAFLSARRETADAELLKVGETCQMAIPSQARKREGVETRRAAPKAATPR